MNNYGQELFNSYRRMISVINGDTHEYYGVHNPAVKSKGSNANASHVSIAPMQTACKQYERRKKKK